MERGLGISSRLDNYAVEKISALVSWNPTRFSRMLVKNDSRVVDFTPQLRQQVERYLMDEERSWGEIEGRLEHVNFHGREKKFFIYPNSGPSRVRCDFVAGLKEAVKRSLDERVVVRGQKHYRRNQTFPHQIKVTEIELLESSVVPHLADLGGALKDDRGTVEAIRQMRDEW